MHGPCPSNLTIYIYTHTHGTLHCLLYAFFGHDNYSMYLLSCERDSQIFNIINMLCLISSIVFRTSLDIIEDRKFFFKDQNTLL